MSKFDYLDITGRALHMFVVVYEEGSVTKAADRLGIGQSAVSHMLDKLREISGDPLFVRSGRGIIATKRAEQLVEQARPILASLQQMAISPKFDPAKQQGLLTIGAGAIQRELLMPRLAKIIRNQAPMLDLRIIESGVFAADLLRKNSCNLLITPSPPEGTEFIQRKLLKDDWVCFYDPDTPAPRTLQQYLARPHAKVVFTENEKSMIDALLEKKGKTRRIALRVSSFSALRGLMGGTDIIITLPRMSAKPFLTDFAVCPLPFNIPPLGFFMAWHLRDNLTPSHKWLRTHLTRIAKEIKG